MASRIAVSAAITVAVVAIVAVHVAAQVPSVAATGSVVPVAADQAVVEMIQVTIPCTKVALWLNTTQVLTNYLEHQSAFKYHQVWTDPEQPVGTGPGNCSAWSMWHWKTRAGMEGLNMTVLAKLTAKFEAAFGEDPPTTQLPTPNGWNLLNSTSLCPAVSDPTELGVVEMLAFAIPCDDIDRFFWADYKVWTNYLRTTPPFRHKQVWLNPAQQGSNTCTYASVIHWADRQQWKSLNATVLAEVQAEFVQAYGSDPTPTEFPSSNGFNILTTTPLCPGPSQASAPTPA